MGREVFVSYKYSDGKETKDKIMKALGKSGHFYNGERGFCKLDVADNTLKSYLSNMIYGTTVTIVVISPEVIYSEWVKWEIKYSLETHTRSGRTNGRNGIVCVIQSNNSYDAYGRLTQNSSWAYTLYSSNTKKIRMEVLPKIVRDNMQDTFGAFGEYFGYINSDESNDDLNDYCIVVSEATFLKNPSKYIEEAYARSNSNDYKTTTRNSDGW